MIKIFLILFIFLYKSCLFTHIDDKSNKNETLYIHLIPHSHDDVGWLKTVDEYYYGSNQDIQWAGVQYIMDTVIDELKKDPKRKFIQVETAFLYLWMINSPKERVDLYKHLVENGQIVFVNGGWCMHDEATPYFEDMIDQMTVGHQFLLQNFNKKPTIGWQIDPFGHSQTNAALSSQMGFNAQWFARVDQSDKQKRLNEKNMEMIWKTSDEDYIFSAVNYQHYSPPQGFNFDMKGYDDPVMSNKFLQSFDLDMKCQQFVNYFLKMKESYQSNHLLHTLGDDFEFSNAIMVFKNMDKIIQYINQNFDRYNMRVLYSTPEIYLKQINQQNITFQENKYDFFPYLDYDNSYWTGYFTSRVALKGYVRQTGRYLQHIRNIFSIDKMYSKSNFLKQNYQLFLSTLDSLEQNMAILQHHDAVAGTAKQKVTDDYVYRIYNSTEAINQVLHSVISEYTQQQIQESVNFTQCNWNITQTEQCPEAFQDFKNGQTLLLNVYNPSVSRDYVLRIKVPNIPFYIIDMNNNFVKGELICLNIYDQHNCDLYFVDKQKAYSYNYYKLVPFRKSENNVEQINKKHVSFFKNHQKFNVSSTTILDVSLNESKYKLITCKNEVCKENEFEILYNYYASYQENGQNSGAYIFRPSNQFLFGSKPYSPIKNKFIYNGKIVTVVYLVGTNTKSELRVYPTIDNVIELQTHVESINIDDNIGKEIVLIVNTNIKNNQTFFTDSNGLNLQKRILNYRPTFQTNITQPSSGNYYPINGIIQIKDVETGEKVSIINDRSQGGTSLEEGQIEIMLHRRTIKDDSRGVGEPLNETEYINGKQVGLQQTLRHYLVFENENTDLPRKTQTLVDSQPIVFYGSSNQEQFKNIQQNSQEVISPLNINKNEMLKVYLRPFGNDYLLRIYNMNENSNSRFQIHQNIQIIQEMTLTANQSKKEWKEKQYQWNGDQEKIYIEEDFNKNGYIDIKPLELRVFTVKLKS